MRRRIFFLACAWCLAATPVFAADVRVLIAENLKTTLLSAQGNYTIRTLPDLKAVKTGNDLKNARVLPSSNGFLIGKENFICRGIQIEAQEERSLFLNKSRFRGKINLLKNNAGLLYAINTLDVEGYLYGVLHHEVSSWWPMEALRAQAIAARTYALYQVQVSRSQEYDLKSSTFSQVYGGSTTERFRTKSAVDQTKGQVLTSDGKIFPAYFHSACGGKTAGAEELWKISTKTLAGNVVCGYCKMSPHNFWHANVPLVEIKQIMEKNGRPVGEILDLKAVTQTPSGRVGSLKITGASGEMTIAAKDFRIWIGGERIRSTQFTLKINEDMVEFKGKGWGHGVGLCQWGSFGQALLGRSHEEILKFYYPDSTIAVNS